VIYLPILFDLWTFKVVIIQFSVVSHLLLLHQKHLPLLGECMCVSGVRVYDVMVRMMKECLGYDRMSV